MKKNLAGFSLITIMIFNFVYMYDLGGSSTKPISNVTIDNLRGNEFLDSDNAIKSTSVDILSKTNAVPFGWTYESNIDLNPITPKANYQVK
ncbi:MAG: hypothetical protein ACW98I_19280, partial [Candidatus Hodarchaeales archaeon]